MAEMLIFTFLMLASANALEIIRIQGPGGRYSLKSAEEAGKACEDRGYLPASKADLDLAFEYGFEICVCAYVSDGDAWLPMQEPRHGCADERGLHHCHWDTKWDAFCKRANEDVPCPNKQSAAKGAVLHDSGYSNDWARFYPEYKFESDGYLVGWEYFSKAKGYAKIFATIWRPLNSGKYQAVSVTKLQPYKIGVNKHLFTFEEEVQVKKGDFVGYSYPTAHAIYGNAEFDIDSWTPPIPIANETEPCGKDEDGNMACTAINKMYKGFSQHRHYEQIFYKDTVQETIINTAESGAMPEVSTPAIRPVFCPIIHDDLDAHVIAISESHESWGRTMVEGSLASRGLRVTQSRLRQSMHRVDPTGCVQRRSQRPRRRQYFVPGVHFIWHIDGNHKLIRWRLVCHGGCDGYSKALVFLTINDNNRAETVLNSFQDGVAQFGVPAFVRADRGGENVDVKYYMSDHPSRGPARFLVGRSVHNQPIERMWRDVFEKALEEFHQLFHRFENEKILDVESELDLTALHFTYIPRIQKHLEEFRMAWYNHPVRTCGYRSPAYLVMTGQNFADCESVTVHDPGEEEVSAYYAGPDVDDTEPVIEVPTFDWPFDDESKQDLQRLAVSTLGLEADSGRGIYIEIRQALHLLADNENVR